jgi:protein O-mannosyl-transferase
MNPLCPRLKMIYKGAMSRPRLLALLLALATLIIYLPATRNGFVNFDDDDYITNNPVVKAGLTLAGIKWAFTTGHASNWHPLTWLSHMTDCQWFGLNPAAHHFVNALLHAANSALVFWLVLRLTQRFWPCVFIAALFAWHPLHVESVAWASERKDVLSTFFALLALLSYVQFAKESSRRHYWLALLFFTLGLLAKPMLVTLPFVFLLLDVWPLQRLNTEQIQPSSFKPLITEKIPFLLLTAASCVVTYLVQANQYHGHTAMTSFHSFGLDVRLGNVAQATTGYLAKFFWPFNLCVFYPLPQMLLIPQVACAAIIVTFISITAWRWRKVRPYFLAGWLWFLGTLVPAIGLIQVGAQSMADRYTYIPSIGFFLAVIFLAAEIVEKYSVPKKNIVACAIVICAICIFATERQISVWQDGESLFRHAVAVQDSDTARLNLGVAIEAKGRLKEAAEQYVAGLALNPARPILHNNLANVLDRLNRPADALAEYRAALQLVPGDASQHTGAGYELGRLGRYDEALAELAVATNLAPRYAPPHIQAAQIYYQAGRDTDGVAEIKLAVLLKPNDWQLLADAAHYLAADENSAARDGATAVQFAARAEEMTGGNSPFITDTLAIALAETGDFNNAVAAEQHALATAANTQISDTGDLQKHLEYFQNHQPWRENFRAPPKTP